MNRHYRYLFPERRELQPCEFTLETPNHRTVEFIEYSIEFIETLNSSKRTVDFIEFIELLNSSNTLLNLSKPEIQQKAEFIELLNSSNTLLTRL